jgi:hypothetical protein
LLKISSWNLDWATPSSKRGKFFSDKFDSDIICLNEGYETVLPQDGYIISSNEDYGYKIQKNRRKVILWSKNKWTEANQIGLKEIPTGRFTSGVTNGIKIVGLCIPWRFNENIPKKNQPEKVFSSLKKMIDGFYLLNSNMGLIHIVISNDLKAESIQRITTENNSDHDGINCSIKFA